MPAKSKKGLTSKSMAEPKKFVVEEKIEETVVPSSEIKKSPEIEKSSKEKQKVTIEENEDGNLNINELKDTPIKISEFESQEEVLNPNNEKDTLPSTNITSFSMLDSDSENKSVENQNKTSENILKSENVMDSENAPTVKSNQDEVNKWIENCDEKESPDKKKNSGVFKIFLIILTVLSFIAIIAGGFFYYQKNINVNKNGKENNEKIETPTDTQPTLQPTAEPTMAVDKVDYSDLSLQILNGSGIPGEAGSVEKMLEDFNFKSIVTGNASNYNYEETVISTKEGLSNQIYQEIKDVLKTSYDIDKEVGSLEESSKYDIVITVGLKN